MFREPPDAARILVVAFGGNVFGMDPKTGKRLWNTEAGGGATPRVLVHEDHVYLLGSRLARLEYATGRCLWDVEVERVFASGAMLVSGGVILIADMGEVAAFDATTGRQLWHDRFKGQGAGLVSLAVPGTAVQADRSG